MQPSLGWKTVALFKASPSSLQQFLAMKFSNWEKKRIFLANQCEGRCLEVQPPNRCLGYANLCSKGFHFLWHLLVVHPFQTP